MILGLLSSTTMAQNEASYQPETGEVFIPKLKIKGDESGTVFSVNMQKIVDTFNFSVTHVDLAKTTDKNIQVGTRPYFLINNLGDGELKSKLQACGDQTFSKTDFSIGHRGAALQYPEHTTESYHAAIRMGAGIVECDVTFSKDKQLVCRHSQCDLHATTDVLNRPDLASKCSVPFNSANPGATECCTSDFTVDEIKSLCGKMDAADTKATTVEKFMNATPKFRTDLYSGCGTIMTHTESIELFKQAGVKMTPELKTPSVKMPYQGNYTQEDYAQQMIAEYKAADIPATDVFPQSFNYSDILYWIKNEPEYAAQAVYLDGRAYGETEEDKKLFSKFNPNNPATWEPRSMQSIVNDGIKYIAPPMWVLVTVEDGKMVPSEYAIQAKAAGLKIITWTLERSGSLTTGGGWYYQTIADVIKNEGDALVLLDVLAQDVGITGIFSDWPGTVTYYANCMNLK